MSAKIKKAMVLAAGKGTRMRPLTDNLPKPLVPFMGKALIDHALDRLAEAGIEEAIVNIHHFADLMEAHLAARIAAGVGPRITISDERGLLLETGGGIKKALPLLGDDPIITFNSDSVWVEGWGQNITRLIEAFDADRMDAILMIADAARTIGYVGRGDFTMAADGALSRRPTSTTVPYMFAGVQIIKPAAFAAGPDGAFSTNLIWDQMLEAGRLFGWRMGGTWMHVGAPDDLADAEAFLREL